MAILDTPQPHEPWNKGKLIGQKAPLGLKRHLAHPHQATTWPQVP